LVVLLSPSFFLPSPTLSGSAVIISFSLHFTTTTNLTFVLLSPVQLHQAPLPNVGFAADLVPALQKPEEEMGLLSTGVMNSIAFTTTASSVVVILKTVLSLTLNLCLLMKPFVLSLVSVTRI
jgi:hypothetical protein